MIEGKVMIIGVDVLWYLSANITYNNNINNIAVNNYRKLKNNKKCDISFIKKY